MSQKVGKNNNKVYRLVLTGGAYTVINCSSAYVANDSYSTCVLLCLALESDEVYWRLQPFQVLYVLQR